MRRGRATRDEITQSPAIIEKQAEPAHANKRSWEKEAVIIGGSAGAGAVVGAVSGGKKGFHDDDEPGSRILARIGEHTCLTPADL